MCAMIEKLRTSSDEVIYSSASGASVAVRLIIPSVQSARATAAFETAMAWHSGTWRTKERLDGRGLCDSYQRQGHSEDPGKLGNAVRAQNERGRLLSKSGLRL